MIGKILAAAGMTAALALPVAATTAASASAAHPAHRSCNISWKHRVVTGFGGNVQSWVDAMSPQGCGTIHSKALCRNRTGGVTEYGQNITAAQGGTSVAQCPAAYSLATGWVVVNNGTSTAHKIYP
jgi:hypothetical protein